MKTKRNVNIKFKLDELSSTKEIECEFHVDESDVSTCSLGYDVIIYNFSCSEKTSYRLG